MRLRFVALVMLAGLGLGGLSACGEKDASEPVTAPAPSIGSPAVVSPTLPSKEGSMRPGDRPPSGSLMSIRGTIRDGVEAGCVLLATDTKTYLLIGGDRSALKAGVQLTVFGTPEPDLMTTCQQGTPFRVSRIES